jgi:adenine specific DNA methylase Mod
MRQALFFMETGFKLHDTMIYRKKNYIPQTAKRYEQEFEFMYCFVKGKINTFNPLRVPCKTAGTSKNFARAGYPRALKTDGSQRRRDEIVTVQDSKIPGNIFSYGTGSNKTGHPAPFPEKLAEDQILTWSNPGDIIYDPCAGSGTTLKVALANGRQFIGSEISAQYCDIANSRLFNYMIS